MKATNALNMHLHAKSNHKVCMSDPRITRDVRLKEQYVIGNSTGVLTGLLLLCSESHLSSAKQIALVGSMIPCIEVSEIGGHDNKRSVALCPKADRSQRMTEQSFLAGSEFERLLRLLRLLRFLVLASPQFRTTNVLV